jgi:ATP synthase subunit 6
MFICSPLEQFTIQPIIKINLFFCNFIFLNTTLILIFFLFALTTLMLICSKNYPFLNLYAIPNRIQSTFELLYIFILRLLKNNVKGKEAIQYFPIIFFIFFFISSLNLMGLIPYSYTLTSQFIITLSLSLWIFIAINIKCGRKHGYKMFSLFLPAGTPILLAFLLVPIELISYIFKPISLAIRLACNMIAGHMLIYVFANFSVILISYSGVLFGLHIFPIIILIILLFLEIAIAFIQAYVFTLLVCIYLNDCLNLH